MPPIAVRLWLWACLGLAGSVLVALAGPHLAGGPVGWWFHPTLGVAPFYAGIVMLCTAWLALGRRAITTRELRVVGATWSLPLLLTAPLFSQDAYSYLAQGTLVHLGIDPYTNAPAVLASVGHAHVLGAVDPFWRHTTSPYGPLFLWIASLVVAVTGSHLVAGVLLIRVLDLAGLVLLAAFAPRLARGLGAEEARATWWVFSPLVLLDLVAGAHNDLLMIGLVVAGITFAIERRLLLGIALCALAATIKLPAAAAIPFILVAYGDRRAWPRGAVLAAVVVLAVSVITGLGLGWISTTVFSTPDKVRLAITPATALGWTVAQVVPVGARGLESALGVVAFGLSLVLGAVLLWRSRRRNMVRNLGIALIAVAVCGPAAWPWYLTWGLVLLAACPGIQQSRLLALAVVASALVVKADGILAFPLRTAPVFLVLYLVAAAVWLSRARLSAAPGRRRVRTRALVES
ncbi:MAG TPA: polyprenol phosphomannose-dependent alpha 1,6 mannosyltransferase MptB [Solirubrobacteraceae bacterium]|nr:polyprenol phosphomannose-dependent alpha 1,6 mannosyltransferase MptB [Solirubrobacteraceae bacterium]